MKTYVSKGEVLEQVAAAPVNAGDLVHIGEIPAMALNDAAIGELATYAVEKVVEGPLAGAASITIGATAYLVAGEIHDTGTEVLGVFWHGTPPSGRAFVKLSPTK